MRPTHRQNIDRRRRKLRDDQPMTADEMRRIIAHLNTVGEAAGHQLWRFVSPRTSAGARRVIDTAVTDGWLERFERKGSDGVVRTMYRLSAWTTAMRGQGGQADRSAS